MLLLSLFWEFFKTGLFAIGGGMATVPFLFRMGENTGWFNASMLADMIAVSESTPGPIGVNMATYVGFTVASIPGAIVATLGLVAPSVIIILIISVFLSNFKDYPVVKTVLTVLRALVIGLLLYAFYQIATIALVDVKTYVMFAVFVVLALWQKKVHPIFWILLGAVLGLLLL
jgi:chromate transporter